MFLNQLDFNAYNLKIVMNKRSDTINRKNLKKTNIMKNYSKLEQFAERLGGILTLNKRFQSSNNQNIEMKLLRKQDDPEGQKTKKLTKKPTKSQFTSNLTENGFSPRYVMKNNNDKNLIIVKNIEIEAKIVEKEIKDKKRLCSTDIYLWSQISYELEHGERINLKYCS